MKQLFLIIAKTAPKEFILSQLKKAIQDYEQDPSKDKADHLSMSLIMGALAFEPTEMDALDAIVELEKQEQWMSIMPKETMS